ncbi:MAG: DUF4349 domain-containing protein [Flammeovirgaceae bacterium]
MKNLLFWITLLGLISSCESTNAVRSPRYRIGGGTEGAPERVKEARVVIYRASAELVVSNVDTVNIRLSQIAKRYGGYVVVLGNKQSSIRVEAIHLEKALNDVLHSGRVRRKTISGQDVTEEYNDFTVRLENANKARQRYLELLARAENVEAALKVEKELERLNGEIDLITGKLNRLNHLSEFSTIEVALVEKKKIGVLGYVGLGIYEAVKWLFVRN